MERAPVPNIVTLALRDRIKLDLEAENNFRFHEAHDFRHHTVVAETYHVVHVLSRTRNCTGVVS